MAMKLRIFRSCITTAIQFSGQLLTTEVFAPLQESLEKICALARSFRGHRGNESGTIMPHQVDSGDELVKMEKKLKATERLLLESRKKEATLTEKLEVGNQAETELAKKLAEMEQKLANAEADKAAAVQKAIEDAEAEKQEALRVQKTKADVSVYARARQRTTR